MGLRSVAVKMGKKCFRYGGARESYTRLYTRRLEILSGAIFRLHIDLLVWLRLDTKIVLKTTTPVCILLYI